MRRLSVTSDIFLMKELAQTLACSLILSKIDYCNAVLHDAPTGHHPETAVSSEECSSWIVLQVSRRSHAKPLLQQLHWLHRIKLSVLTYKVRSTSTPVCLHCRIAECVCSRTLRSPAIPLLDQPLTKTYFSRRAFRFSAPSVWYSLPQTVLISDSLSVF